jgi:hypothetical protein
VGGVAIMRRSTSSRRCAISSLVCMHFLSLIMVDRMTQTAENRYEAWNNLLGIMGLAPRAVQFSEL